MPAFIQVFVIVVIIPFGAVIVLSLLDDREP
jgi:hypothetical protein